MTKKIRKKLLGFEVGMTYYSTLEKDEEDIIIPFVVSLYITSTKIVELLPGYLECLRRDECPEVLGVNLDMMTSTAYWMKNNKLKHDMEALNDLTLRERGIEYAYNGRKVETTLDLYRMIEESVLGIVELLKVYECKMMKAPDSLYGNFYLSQKATRDRRQVEADYLRWKRDVAAISFDLLKDKQTLVVAEFLKKKILRFTQIPSDRERELVDLDKVRPHLPYGYELPEEFRNCCARFRRFISWDGDILRINYDCYGKYLFQFYYSLTPAERQALVELDLMLDLIHQDMVSPKGINLPKVLATPEARMLLEKARKAGYLDDQYQPKISNTMSAILADEIATRLKIRNKWKVFEQFWNRHDMYKDNYEGRDQKQSSQFLDEIKKILG